MKTKIVYWKTVSGATSVIQHKIQMTPEGIANGYCRHYYKNGQLLSKVKYEDNKLIEIYEVNDSLGKKINYGNFRNGNGYAI